MKKIFSLGILLGAVFVILSCLNKKIPTDKMTQIVVEEGFVVGVITDEYEKEGCKYLIKVKKESKEFIYTAINLDESLKQNGKYFQFKYKPIKSPRRGGCKRGIYIFIKEFQAL